MSSLKNNASFGKNGKISKEAFLNVNQVAAIEFLKKENPSMTSADVAIVQKNLAVITDKGLKILQNTTANGRSSSISDFGESIISDASPFISQGQKIVLTSIFEVLEENSDDIKSLLRGLDTIESKIQGLPVEEQPIVFQALSIARHSAQYWHANYQNWQEAVNGSNGTGRTQVRWGAVAVCDVGSAICMAVGCWFAGPVGWGFAVKACAGAATVGSAIAATF